MHDIIDEPSSLAISLDFHFHLGTLVSLRISEPVQIGAYWENPRTLANIHRSVL
jgi:hypothetical protein